MKALMIVVVLLLGAAVAAAAVLGARGGLTSLRQRATAAVSSARHPAASSPAAATAPGPTAAAAQTLLDASGSGSQITQDFTVGGPWDLAWSVDCSRAGQARGFGISIENGGGTPARETLLGVNELAEQKQATLHYTAVGTFHLNVSTDPPCSWHATVTGPPGTPTTIPAGRTLLDITGSGPQTSRSFVAGGAWDLSWSYDCTSVGHATNFGVDVVSSGDSGGEGVIQLGEREAGLAHEPAGTFHLKVDTPSSCRWHLTAIG